MLRKRWTMRKETIESNDDALSTTESHNQIYKKMGYKKGLFTAEEDEVIIDCIERGIRDFRAISARIDGRSPKQVKDRYEHSLDPTLERGPWSFEEDCLLVREQLEFGNIWKQISKVHLPRRSDNAIKNRFHSVAFKNITKQYAAYLSQNSVGHLNNGERSQQSILDYHKTPDSTSNVTTTSSSEKSSHSSSNKIYAENNFVNFELFEISASDSFKSKTATSSDEMDTCDTQYPITSDYRTHTDASTAPSSVEDFDTVFIMNNTVSSINNTTATSCAAAGSFFSIAGDSDKTSIKYLSSLSLDSCFDKNNYRGGAQWDFDSPLGSGNSSCNCSDKIGR